MQRLLPPALVLILIAVMALLSAVVPVGTLPWTVLRLLGLAPAVIGLGLTVSGGSLFSRTGTNIKTFNDPDILVTDGPFRWSRNPMYLGFLLLLTGLALLAGTLSAWIGPAAFFVAANQWYIPFEEARMHQTFGERYTNYCHLVPRWLRFTALPQIAR